MTVRHRKFRQLAPLLLPLLAATLACNSLTGAGANPNATLNAAATLVATAASAFTPSVAATAAAAFATSAATPAAAGAPTQTPAPGSGTALDPCSLMTTDEATALVGVPAGKPTPVGTGGCAYFDSSVTLTGAGLFLLPASQAQGFLAQYVPALQANGVTLDQTAVDKLAKDSAAGDMPASVNDLLALSNGLPGYEIKKLDGVGSAALWSWHTLDQNQQGALLAAKPGALVALILSGTPTTQEAVAQPAMVKIVARILANLPANFTVPSQP